jgi:2-polyprenyl-6-hydroxyphenyl methylase / 3-demethylubiquinone-9 3-methyltransferase
MAIQIDPEQNEHAALTRVGASFEGARVLEIGCGDGRLTEAIARLAKSIVAIEPDREFAADFRSRSWPAHVEFLPIAFEAFAPAGRRFDVVLFSWSL